MIFGYCRVSRPSQRIERQITNITRIYPDAVIIKEIHTRTSMDGRKEWAKLMRKVRRGDVLVFDSVSRMSGNEEEGFAEYKRLFELGVELEFLNEPTINTSLLRDAQRHQIALTNTEIDPIIRGINEFMWNYSERLVKAAFAQAQKEVDDLRKRTREGIREAASQGKQIGRPPNKIYTTKKYLAAKPIILKHCKEFGGQLKDTEVIAIAKIDRKSYYKYKSLIREELAMRNK